MNMSSSRLTAFTLLSAFSIVAHAQAKPKPRALFNDSSSVTGGYLGFTPKFTNVMGTDVLLLGFSGAFVLEHKLAMGLAGAWSSSPVRNDAYTAYLLETRTEDLSGLELRYGYGGLLVEPLILGGHAVHLSVPVILGIGSVSYSYPRSNSGSNSNQRNRTDGQAFFVVEPGLELEITVVEAFRIGLGGSYLWTSDLDLPLTSPDALRNYTARMTVKLGGW